MNRVFLFLLVIFVCGCGQEYPPQKFVIVSSYNQVIDATDDELEAYQKAHSLTLMSRSFSSKACYFVIKNK